MWFTRAYSDLQNWLYGLFRSRFYGWFYRSYSWGYDVFDTLIFLAMLKHAFILIINFLLYWRYILLQYLRRRTRNFLAQGLVPSTFNIFCQRVLHPFQECFQRLASAFPVVLQRKKNSCCMKKNLMLHQIKIHALWLLKTRSMK